MSDQVLAIVGPTASGKSDVALALAGGDGGEIISCDSVQVYRGFTIGCAKPSDAEQAQTVHHLIDVVEWNEPFDAQLFRKMATLAIDGAGQRGRRPIVCGGTGLYLRALRWGLADTPPADPALRSKLAEREQASPGSLFQMLQEKDPASAQRIEPRNLVQIIRALEIGELTGEPASVVRGRHGFRTEQVPMRVVALEWPRDVLRERIVSRSRQMIEKGLLDEVRGLLRAGVAPDCRPMTSVGYREACAVVLGHAPEGGLAERIATSTWRYAKRQLTWLRKERDIEWVAVTGAEQAIAAVLEIQ